MKKTLEETRDPEGVGLAAPQVDLSIRLFLAKPEAGGVTKVFINPKILKQDKIIIPKSKKTKNKLLEGCLSIPRIWGHIARSNTLTLQYQDETGKQTTEEFDGFISTVIQHELDHLNGVLFTTRVLEQNNTLFKEVRDEKGESEFEEIKIRHSSSIEEMEKDIISEHEGQLKMPGIDGKNMAYELMNSLKSGKMDGETNAAFEERIISESMKVLLI